MSTCLTQVQNCIACSVTTPTDCAACKTPYTLTNRGACERIQSAATVEMLMITLMVIVLTIMCAVF